MQDDADAKNTFRVADWLVEPELLRMVRGTDEIKLEPKVMQVLVHLTQHAGQVVSREQLEASVWRGVIVGYDSLGSAIIKLRKAFNDDPRNPAVIQTIPKKGYRLIAPVSYGGDGEVAVSGRHATSVVHAQRRSPRVLHILVLSIVVIIGVWLVFLPAKLTEPEQPPETLAVPGVAVLPFKNLSDDTQQEYFSDGITFDLITDLANIDSIAVIARNSVFTYKNTDVDVRRVREELGVDYVVEGSVRRAGETVRITARLINARNGTGLWAERFDAEFRNVFAIQDKVVEQIVAALEVKLSKQEQARIARVYTSSIAAYDHFLHGWQHFWRYTREDNEQAREYYFKAVELDPYFARAYANLAVTFAFDYMNGWSDAPDKTLQQARQYADKAVMLDDALPQVQWAVGIVDTYSRDYAAAIRAAEKAIAASPNFADGYGLLATVLNYAGKPDEARQIMHKAMQLNPRHPFIYKMILGQIHFNLREYEAAADNLADAAFRNPSAQEVRLWLAAAYAYLGRKEDAYWELEQIRSTGVDLSSNYIEQFIPLQDPQLRKHLLDGLIKAGLQM